MKKLNIVRLFLFFVGLLFIMQQAEANISGAHGINGRHCPSGGYGSKYFTAITSLTIDPGMCTVSSNMYPPRSGYYSIYTGIINADTDYMIQGTATAPVWLDGSKTISGQTVTADGGSEDWFAANKGQTIAVCQYILDDAGKWYYISSNPNCIVYAKPLPPTPAPPDTACTINSGNALNVNLNNVERAQLPTVPGSGSMRHLQIPVDCTGGDVTVNMKLNYTPITLNAGQVVKSSSNGLGVSIVYNSKVISTTDTTPITFTNGSNSVDLAFQAVRDPNVEIKDIPTGAFTASAVLVMTQQ